MSTQNQRTQDFRIGRRLEAFAHPRCSVGGATKRDSVRSAGVSVALPARKAEVRKLAGRTDRPYLRRWQAPPDDDKSTANHVFGGVLKKDRREPQLEPTFEITLPRKLAANGYERPCKLLTL